MERQIFVCICCALLLLTDAFAEDYPCNHFVICSDLDPGYVQFIQANAEAYYDNLQGGYFRAGWLKPLTIYYSKTQSDTQQLLNKQGHEEKVNYGFYDPGKSAVYMHQFMNNGEHNDWANLFHEITHHFVYLNYPNCPAWFSEGLGCFLGEETLIVKGELTMGRPSPWREQILRDEIEQGRRLNIKRLFSSSSEQFYEWDAGYHFARAFFYWLHETGLLKKYLKDVREKGYEITVLEETVSEPYGKINVELSKFIKTDCYAGAYLNDGKQAEDEAEKVQAFIKAIELKPDYHAARLELAGYYYKNRDYDKCRENLKQILDAPESVEYQQACRLMANTFYNRKDYLKALEYYKMAWEYSKYYEYKHRLAYRIGNCYHYLKDSKNAKKWYKEFLDCSWEKENMKASCDYARKYIGCETAIGSNHRGHKQDNKLPRD